MSDLLLVAFEDVKPQFELASLGGDRQSVPRRTPGLLSLVSTLRHRGFDVELLPFAWDSYETCQERLVALADRIDQGPRVVGISSMTPYLPFSLDLAKEIKARNPDRIVLMGGPGPSGEAMTIMQHFPAVDAIGVGEGEETLAEVLERFRRGQSLEGCRGMVWRKGEEIRQEPARPLIANIDSLPPTEYNLVSQKGYATARYFSSRGCPYNCGFCCCGLIWGKRWRHHSLGRMMSDLEGIHEAGFRMVAFDDEIFTLDRRRVMGLCSWLQESYIPFRWGCNGRVDLLDQELMETMAASGCIYLALGVETGSRRLMERHKGGFTLDQAYQRVTQALPLFRSVIVHLIYGYPDETWQDFEDTLDAAMTFGEMGAKVTFYRLTPFPHSPLFERYGDHIRLQTKNLEEGHQERLAFGEDIIRRYPTLGAAFYTYETPQMARKMWTAAAAIRYLIAGQNRADLVWYRGKSRYRGLGAS